MFVSDPHYCFHYTCTPLTKVFALFGNSKNKLILSHDKVYGDFIEYIFIQNIHSHNPGGGTWAPDNGIITMKG